MLFIVLGIAAPNASSETYNYSLSYNGEFGVYCGEFEFPTNVVQQVFETHEVFDVTCPESSNSYRIRVDFQNSAEMKNRPLRLRLSATGISVLSQEDAEKVNWQRRPDLVRVLK